MVASLKIYLTPILVILEVSQLICFMFRAIGVVIILWYLSSLFTHTFRSADSAFSATFKALEAAAKKSEHNFIK